MNTKETLRDLRKSHNLSQDEFAEKLFVTRQAVSRWENGETIPNIETLKLISESFDVTIDAILGQVPKVCQSCGTDVTVDSEKGTQQDGSLTDEFCQHCYQEGRYTRSLTMDQMIESNLEHLDEWNQASGLSLSKEEAKSLLQGFLPTLKRWKA